MPQKERRPEAFCRKSSALIHFPVGSSRERKRRLGPRVYWIAKLVPNTVPIPEPCSCHAQAGLTGGPGAQDVSGICPNMCEQNCPKAHLPTGHANQCTQFGTRKSARENPNKQTRASKHEQANTNRQTRASKHGQANTSKQGRVRPSKIEQDRVRPSKRPGARKPEQTGP